MARLHSTKHSDPAFDMQRAVEQSTRKETLSSDVHYFRTMSRDPSQQGVPKLATDEDIGTGSFGAFIDSHIGMSPIDGPPGYTLQKVEYTHNAITAETVHASYRPSNHHRGLISCVDADGTRLTFNLNEDQEGGTGIAGQNKLQDGDLILGAILQLVDQRSENRQTGTITAGMCPTVDGTVTSNGTLYGSFDSSKNDAAFLAAQAIGGAKSVSAGAARSVCVSTFHLDTHFPHRVATTPSGLNPFASPLLSIVVDGINPTNSAASLQFKLHVYTLMGARPSGVRQPVLPGGGFRLADLKSVFASHPVTIMYR